MKQPDTRYTSAIGPRGQFSQGMRCRAPEVCLLFAMPIAAASAAGQVTIEASRQGSTVAIDAHATLKAPFALIWSTLTDYDHLANFIPGMTASRVVERHGGTAVVEQTGSARFLGFHYPLKVVVESSEQPPGFIGIRA